MGKNEGNPGRKTGTEIDKPADFEQRLQSALDDQAKGDRSGALKQFIALIDDGCPEAYAFAGVIYEIGCPGVEKDYERARFYYERAIEQLVSVEAYLGLGRIYYFGRWRKGVEKRRRKGVGVIFY